jgi:hypothetical protein
LERFKTVNLQPEKDHQHKPQLKNTGCLCINSFFQKNKALHYIKQLFGDRKINNHHMKKRIATLLAALFLTGALITACGSKEKCPAFTQFDIEATGQPEC